MAWEDCVTFRQILPVGTRKPAFARLEEEIERYDLRDHIAELDDQGLCVVPPSKLQLAPDFVARARAALMAVAEARTGAGFHLVNGRAGRLNERAERIGQFYLTHLLHEGPIFEEIYVHPVSACNGWVKFRTPASFDGVLTTGLHADTTAPLPWPLKTPHVANMNWILTRYSREDGALAYVPESHKRGTVPPCSDVADGAVAVDAPAGSMIFFHGATWHGAFRRQTDGLRLSIHGLCCQPHYMPQQDYRGAIGAEIFARSADPEYLRMLTRDDDPGLRTSPAEMRSTNVRRPARIDA
jgi:hypothetical protein